MLGKKEKEPATVEEPFRSETLNTTASDDAIPVEKGDIGGLLVQRLQAWKHAVGYLEAYVTSTERAHKEFAKEYEKVLKVGPMRSLRANIAKIDQTVSEPLKEGNHFGNQPFPQFLELLGAKS